MSGTFKLDSAGVRQILNSPETKAMSLAAARQIADAIQSRDGVEVKVVESTTDRAGASVIIAHPGGLGMQAKHGYLTRAAASVGLTVRPR